jgi:predicted transcriptional regulator
LDKLDETKNLVNKPINLDLCQTVQTIISNDISKYGGYDIGSLWLQVDILHKFVSDIAKGAINNQDDIKTIAKCLTNINNDADAKDISNYA